MEKVIWCGVNQLKTSEYKSGWAQYLYYRAMILSFGNYLTNCISSYREMVLSNSIFRPYFYYRAMILSFGTYLTNCISSYRETILSNINVRKLYWTKYCSKVRMNLYSIINNITLHEVLFEPVSIWQNLVSEKYLFFK